MKNSGILKDIPYLIVAIIIAFSILQLLRPILSTDFPVVSVVSGSMRHDTGLFEDWVKLNNKTHEAQNWKFNHGLKEGDMIIVVGAEKKSLNIGDVVVYESPEFKYPIIHRIIGISEDGKYIIKGDNNPNIDPHEVEFEWIKGEAVFAVPALGIPRYAIIKTLQI